MDQQIKGRRIKGSKCSILQKDLKQRGLPAIGTIPQHTVA